VPRHEEVEEDGGRPPGAPESGVEGRDPPPTPPHHTTPDPGGWWLEGGATHSRFRTEPDSEPSPTFPDHGCG